MRGDKLPQLESIVSVNIDLIEPSQYQPRKIFNDKTIDDLAESIKEFGILNPILLRKKADNKYEIIAGERRYRAAKKAGLTEVPAIIKDIPEDKVPQLALIENLQREDISPLEEAKTYRKILENSNITEEQLSKIIGKSQSFISNKIRLLSLPKNVQKALFNKEISERHARSLLTVKDEDKQNRLLARIINEKLTVKELDNLINEEEITEDELDTAIDEIMASLKNEPQKEEKESDNMNNGSYFPGFNPSNNNSNQGFTYNPNQSVDAPIPPVIEDMNTQNEAPPVPEPIKENPVETNPPINPIPDFSLPTAPTLDSNQGLPQVEENPLPILENNPLPVEEPSIPVEPQNTIQEPVPAPAVDQVPLIKEPNNPMADNNIYNQDINNAIPNFDMMTPQVSEMIDPPLFAGPTQSESQPIVDNILTPEPVPQSEGLPTEPPILPAEPPQPDEELSEKEGFEAVKEMLTQSGIIYKAYSNDTGHCIIIEF